MAHYMGLGIAMLVAGLAPSIIRVVGKLTRAWDRLSPIIECVVKERYPDYAKSRIMTRIVPTDDTLEPRLLGAVALVFQKHLSGSLLAMD
jgi:hypothetical protein